MGLVFTKSQQISHSIYVWFDYCHVTTSPSAPRPPLPIVTAKVRRTDSFITFSPLLGFPICSSEVIIVLKNSWREVKKRLLLLALVREWVSEARREKKICEVHCPYSICISISPSLPPPLLLKAKTVHWEPFLVFPSFFFSQTHSSKQPRLLQKWTAEITVSLNLQLGLHAISSV